MKIAFASGKGGTGKTTLSTNFASFLATKYKVVLTDLDVEEPNSGLFIKADLLSEETAYRMVPQWIPDKCTFCRECQNNCVYNAVIQTKDKILVFPNLCHSCYACSDLCPEDTLPMKPFPMGVVKHYSTGNLHFVESRLNIGEEMAVPLIAHTIDYIDKNFDNDFIKIFDAPPGTSCPVIEATKNADFVVLVTEPTPFGLHDLKLAVETMRELGKDFAVIINRYGIGDQEVEKYCMAENIPILATIPNNRKIAELYSKGSLLWPELDEVKEQMQKLEAFFIEKIRNRK